MAEGSIEPSVLIYVSSAGAVGGVVSVIIPYLTPTFGQPYGSWYAIPGSMLVGAVVAVVGVFVLFNTDRQDRIRLIALSLLCGVLWQPTLQMAQNFLTGVKQREQDSIALQAIKVATNAVQNDARGSTSQNANALVGQLQMLNSAGPKIAAIQSPEVKAQATAEFLAASGRVQSALAKAPLNVRKESLPELTKLRELQVIRSDPEQNSALLQEIQKVN